MTSNSIPILEVSDENFDQLWPALDKAVKEASFIAIDCELSGLGDRSKLNCSEIDLRYQHIKNIAQDYAIVSLGLCCFSCQSSSSVNLDSKGPNQSVKTHNYIVQTFNILTFCSMSYMVEYSSVRFLRAHGFDFNRQYSHGLPYTRGEDRESRKRKCPSVRDLFHLIIRYGKPIVLHNGLVDLLFLYQAFYADLPRNIETFAADLLEMFPAGIYDTKYISEFHQNFSATYLQYLFKKSQLENEGRMNSGAWHCRVKFLPYPQEGVKGLNWHYYRQVFDHNQAQPEEDRQPLCESYKYHGWCGKATACTRSHDVDRIVWELPPPKARKRTACAGLSYSSVAQLISFKKRKLEEERTKAEETPGRLANGESSSSSLLQENGGLKKRADSPIVDAKKADKVNGGGSATGATQDVENCRSASPAAEGRRADSSGCNSPLAPEDGEAPPGVYVERASTGHSAGLDAFMTGFTFACDVAALGQLPSVAAFQSPEEMKFHDLVSKVYLIGKEFPFLVRSSAYGGTSPTHDRIIKAMREQQSGRPER